MRSYVLVLVFALLQGAACNLATLKKITHFAQEKQTQLFEKALVTGRALQSQSQPCVDEIIAASVPNPPQSALEALTDCLFDVVEQQLESCLGDFPGVWAPTQCLLFSDDKLKDIVSGAATGDVNATESEEQCENIGEAGEDQAPFLDSADPLTLQQCESVFGTSGNIEVLGCMSLINVEDIENFNAAVADGFSQYPNCAALNSEGGETDDSGEASDEESLNEFEQLQPKIEAKLSECEANPEFGIQSDLDQFSAGSTITSSMLLLASLLVIMVSQL